MLAIILDGNSPMLVVRPNRKRNIRVRKDGKRTIRFWGNGGALYVLIMAKANVDRRFAWSF